MGAIQRKPGRSGLCVRWLALVLALTIGACSGDNDNLEFGVIEGFTGAVAADEPRAALIGQRILGIGGNAVDAAIAVYYSMAVTIPSRAGLGGGGICLVFANQERDATIIEFLPHPDSSGRFVPRGIRAMAALHARYGSSRWQNLISPAENLARFGHPVSRAFARDLSRAAGEIRANPELSRLFATAWGAVPQEGDQLVQIELSTVLAGIRSQGAGYFYAGRFARQFAEAASAIGHTLQTEDVRRSVPQFGTPVMVELEWKNLYFSVPPAVDGLVAAELWQLLNGIEDYGAADADERPHLFVEAAARAFADRAAWLTTNDAVPDDLEVVLDEDRQKRIWASYDPSQHTPGFTLRQPAGQRPENADGASFVVGDRWGNAVACSLTMNGLFGSGRVPPGTGILLAARPEGDDDGTRSPSLAILAQAKGGDAHMAVAASGGAASPTALVAVMLDILIDERPLDLAVAAPRLHHGGVPDVVLYEPKMAPTVLDGLRERGHVLRPAEALGRINAFYCVEGLRDSEAGCAARTDPRGWGLGGLAQ